MIKIMMMMMMIKPLDALECNLNEVESNLKSRLQIRHKQKEKILVY